MSLKLQQGSGGETISAGSDYKDEKYPNLKLADGTADSSQAIESGNGTAAESLRIALASDSDGQVKATNGTAAIGSVKVTEATTSGIASMVGQSAAVTDVSVSGLAKRTATPADYSGSDGDYELIQVDNGRTHIGLAGTKAHDAEITAFDRPLLLGMETVETDSSQPSLVAEGDAIRMKCDLSGLMLVGGL